MFNTWMNTLKTLKRRFGQSNLEALNKEAFFNNKNITYNEVKMEANDYQTAKLKVII